MDFEDLLVEVGDYGKYQKKLVYLFLVPSSALLPWFFLNTLFMVSVPDHWCNVPELSDFNLTLEQQKLLIRPPGDPKCSRYQLNYTELLSSPEWNWTIPENATTERCKSGYIYDKTDYEKTAATVWNMVCDDSHYTSLILTLAAVGSIFGTPIYGYLSDKVGRKPTFLLTAVVTLVSGVISVLMSNFSAFVVMRTINGSIMPSVFQVPFIILLEIVGPTMRTRMNGFANLFWTVGLCFLPLIAWLTRDWVLFGLITSSVTVIFFSYWKFLPESPRWLLSQGRYEESMNIMHAISKTNGQSHNREDLLQHLKKLGEKIENEKQTNNAGKEASISDIIKYPKLRKHFIILTSCWVACGTSYYGLQINVPNLGGNEFLTFFLLAVVEIPGYMFSWYFMEKWGRRWCSVFTLILTGIVLLIPVFDERAGVVTSIIGKFGCSAAFMVMYQQSSELYPTVLRAIGMGLSGTVNGVISIAVPYIVFLSEYGKFIPFLIISIICLIVGCMASFLPETLNEVLPQTVTDSENFAIHQKFFSCNRRRRPSCYENRISLPHIYGDSNNAQVIRRTSEQIKTVDGSRKSLSENASNGDTHRGSVASSKHSRSESLAAKDKVQNDTGMTFEALDVTKLQTFRETKMSVDEDKNEQTNNKIKEFKLHEANSKLE